MKSFSGNFYRHLAIFSGHTAQQKQSYPEWASWYKWRCRCRREDCQLHRRWRNQDRSCPDQEGSPRIRIRPWWTDRGSCRWGQQKEPWVQCYNTFIYQNLSNHNEKEWKASHLTWTLSQELDGYISLRFCTSSTNCFKTESSSAPNSWIKIVL